MLIMNGGSGGGGIIDVLGVKGHPCELLSS